MKLLISGALGKMGKKVYAEALNQNIEVVCGIDYKEVLDGDFPVYNDFSKAKDVDVIIDFSSPSNLDNLLNFAVKNKVPAVLCTTGYTAEQEEQVKKASETIPIFRSQNMSLGVNVLSELVKTAVKSLYGFDIEIIEKHHNEKVDAPSGTAIMLANAVKSVDNEKFNVYGRNGIVGKRNKNEIGIHSVRGGNIVGEHQVIFAGNSETITLTHEATDRAIFAVGAVKASTYIVNQKAGLYDMQKMISGK